MEGDVRDGRSFLLMDISYDIMIYFFLPSKLELRKLDEWVIFKKREIDRSLFWLPKEV